MYYPRDVEDRLKEAAKYFEAIVAYGARQVEKSTTAKAVFSSGFSYVALGDSDELSLALSNPKAFLESHPWPVLIDEVQKAPNLLSLIKLRIDEERERKLTNGGPKQIMYVLTGSNRFELQEGISESLAGRVAVFEMGSFTQMEIARRKGSCFYPEIRSLLEKRKRKAFLT